MLQAQAHPLRRAHTLKHTTREVAPATFARRVVAATKSGKKSDNPAYSDPHWYAEDGTQWTEEGGMNDDERFEVFMNEEGHLCKPDCERGSSAPAPSMQCRAQNSD